MAIDFTPYSAANRMAARLFTCMFRQHARLRYCPDLPRLDGKLALVTGGTAGVGEFVSRGLLARGARVVSLSRGVSQGKEALPEVQSISCDLSNLTSVAGAVDKLRDQKIDLLICNSGIALREHAMTSDGIEMTFAVNVLGHHLLYRLLQQRGMFAINPRIVMTTSEAYFAGKTCDSNPSKYRMNQVYGGSKLGNLWQVLELNKHYPNINSYAVHPGVILSGFGGGVPTGGFKDWLAKKILISEEQGAQAALIAATQDLPNGAYWHNVCGIMSLPKGDAALDIQKADKLWGRLEELIQPFTA